MDVRYKHPSRASLRAFEDRQARRQRNRTVGAVVGGVSVAVAAAAAVLRAAGVGGPSAGQQHRDSD
ncbi:hypothetical protein [Catenulispora pinisilvae]|uniref:hypothetical protein n=1 Tax=Catenulispora pinisilvae TaxID=2705253 RepID=UPI00189152ED|nr:hypothetical protein [Catenulispora pinisilvae]